MGNRRYIPAKELSAEALRKRRAGDAQRKRKQLALQKAETIEEAHQRRQVALKTRHEKVFTNLENKFDQSKKVIARKQDLRMTTLRKAGKLTEETDRQNLAKHFDMSLKLQNKYKKDFTEREQRYQTQTNKLRLTQRRQNPNPKTPFTIESVFTTDLKKYSMYKDEFRVVVNHPPVEIVDVLTATLHRVVDDRKLVEGDHIRLVVNHNNWDNHISTKGVIIRGDKKQLFSTIIKNVLETAIYREAPISELELTVKSAKAQRATGRLYPTKKNLAKKKSLTIIKNLDTMCAARAIVTGLANLNPGGRWSKSQIKNGFNASRKLQTTEALKLHEESGVEISPYGNTVEDLNAFAEHLNVQISVIADDYKHTLVHTTPNEYGKGMCIYLLKSDNHFDLIKSMGGFLNKSYFCHGCKNPYTKRDLHKCAFKCTSCFAGSSGDCSGESQECPECNRTFFGKECFDEHKRNRGVFEGVPDIVCDRTQICRLCRRTTKDLSKHICGYSTCSNCRAVCDLSTHKCFMKKRICKGGNCEESPTCEELIEAFRKDLEAKKPGLKKAPKKCRRCLTITEKYCTWDVETDQSTGTHIVNLIHCRFFSGEEFTFSDIESFCEFVFSPQCSGYTFIAHNAKAFDNYFVLKYCVARGIIPYTIKNGAKIMYMSFRKNKVKFLDSVNHIPGKLANFPKTFGFTELKKGYFPHLYNIPQNQKYIGEIPDISFYNPDQMSTKDRASFLKWHKERVDENFVFDFYKELLEYCRSDVDILWRGMKSYRQLFLNICNIDPLQYITIAGDVMNIFREKFMHLNEIAIVKDTTANENYSKLSIGWLDFEAERSDVKIQHVLNGGEFVTPAGKVDGFCESTNTVYEFQGCFWHGCPECFSDKTVNPKNQIEMGELHKRTKVKNAELQSLGYNLVEMYECQLSKEFKKWSRTNPREFVEPLNPRDAFFGGRTNSFKLRKTFAKGEKGFYVDFVSLYPTVNYDKRYPVGHPIKIFDPDFFDTAWFGFVKCKVEPPRGLYHPVLPVKTKCGNADKLLFPLCRTCSEFQLQETCTHNSEERSFVGTWCSNELLKAIEKGYQVSKIYEVWHFEETTTNMFKDYVKKFLKIKMESSKMVFGPNCTYKSEEEFRELTKERHGFTLGKIEFNPGMRAIAKLCLNSLWGKFGQRTNLPNTTYVTTLKEFWEILLDDTFEDVDYEPMNEDMVQMTYCLKDQFVDNFDNTNIFIAAFTTSHAREMLYEKLDLLGRAALGCDTDSIWATYTGDKLPIKTGDSLGDMTNELDDGEYIVGWTSTGPKTYCYKTNFGRIVCKNKGFTLNHENSQKINFETMTQLVEGEISSIFIERKNAITRDAKTCEIVNKDQHKTFSCNYNKRVVLEDFDTLPYGY